MKMGYKLAAEAFGPKELVRQAILSDCRFTLGVGSGERLNEHVVGQGFGSVTERHERLVEALDIINLLWQGGYQSYQGRHLRLEDARVFDLPPEPPVIAVAAGGPRAAELAATHGSGLFATDPDPELVRTFLEKGGKGPRYAEVAVAWAPTEAAAVTEAHRTTRWAVTGWKVMSELPNPVNFEAASATVTEDDIRAVFVAGPDPAAYVEAVTSYREAGFDHVVLMNAGPDPDGFLDFFASDLRDRLTR